MVVDLQLKGNLGAPDEEMDIFPGNEDMTPWPKEPVSLETDAVLSFGEGGQELFRTRCDEILAAYLVACAWKRLPEPHAGWVEGLPISMRLTTRTPDGALRMDFSDREDVASREAGLAWLCAVETNPDDKLCAICGSEMFLLFRDETGRDHRLERLSVMTAILALSAAGHIPKLPHATIRALELEYDHIRHSEHVLLGLGRGEPADV